MAGEAVKILTLLIITWSQLSSQQLLKPLDIEKDSAVGYIMSALGAAVYSSVSPTASDASLVLRMTMLMANAFFDANAPYTPTTVGIYSNLGRR